MPALHTSPSLRPLCLGSKPRKRRKKVPARRVREMLREIAFVLHATKVVGLRNPAVSSNLR